MSTDKCNSQYDGGNNNLTGTLGPWDTMDWAREIGMARCRIFIVTTPLDLIQESKIRLGALEARWTEHLDETSLVEEIWVFTGYQQCTVTRDHRKRWSPEACVEMMKHESMQEIGPKRARDWIIHARERQRNYHMIARRANNRIAGTTFDLQFGHAIHLRKTEEGVWKSHPTRTYEKPERWQLFGLMGQRPTRQWMRRAVMLVGDDHIEEISRRHTDRWPKDMKATMYEKI